MGSQLVQIGMDALAVLVPALVALAIEFVRRKLGTEKVAKLARELETKKELASLAVRFVEQVYKDVHGPAKLQEATEWMSARAKQMGVSITPEEIKGLIEAALRDAKDSFGEEWGKVKTAGG
ncbi:MAG: phage holin, LL-H family protein [Peptococcaceae bacterium BICA1-7]|nr:MAG: phage holin, LL-H family protein [Peptococcaceae bacterium BICA1-7]HBV97790.1 phage holin [Desulfotomaculum sp.]